MSLDISFTLYTNSRLPEKKSFLRFSSPNYEITGKEHIFRIVFQGIHLVLLLVPLAGLNEIFQTSIIGPFNRIREKTCGKLVSAPVVTEAFTTDSFPATRITTITRNLVFLYLTFDHSYDSPTTFLNSFSSMMVNPSFFAFSYFEPGSVPTTT